MSDEVRKKKPVVLLTNNFEFTVEDISEIYRLRWAIESLYKQLKNDAKLTEKHSPAKDARLENRNANCQPRQDDVL